MPLLLQPPEFQAVDGNGLPYAGGSVGTYIPGTDTPKDTWVDKDGTALNANPIILDAAGRCIIFGDGEYRLVLRDADGNLIYDQWTSCVVSDAMQPVVVAPTIADAVQLLGIQDMIDASVSAEQARAQSVEAGLATAINNEVARATNAEATLTTNLNAEIARAEAAEANLQSQIDGLHAASSSWLQIYTRYQQDTSLAITVPAGKSVRITAILSPGSYSGGTDTTWQASGEFWRDGVLLNRVGYIGSTDDTTYPSPPNYPWGLLDAATGSPTYTVHYYVHPDVAAAMGSSDWTTNFSATASCYLLLELM